MNNQLRQPISSVRKVFVMLYTGLSRHGVDARESEVCASNVCERKVA